MTLQQGKKMKEAEALRQATLDADVAFDLEAAEELYPEGAALIEEIRIWLTWLREPRDEELVLQ